MSSITRHNIYRHELIGLQVVVESRLCSFYSGVRGRIIDETKNILVVYDGVKKRRIPKEAANFRFILPDNSTVLIEGRKIIGRPEDRIKA